MPTITATLITREARAVGVMLEDYDRTSIPD